MSHAHDVPVTLDTIVSPSDGQVTSATAIAVTGGVTDASLVSVIVNGVTATLGGSRRLRLRTRSTR